ncbi:cysteine--tRNA ligase [Lentibacillus amyloliquefaciens]|uniref:Cysteine--tRNA ligase n=1 Tax=Lentibacillus amyloliquefaciens TaxID=1472767 RepID=A0A0U4FUC8_9BACI|nr:cysteine--tRNA ligase [Lentibacillus amyloliquefaciens]ALX49413.1 cysteine--tRNA ligase [Lentibacillus amyloliquefaciens]
MTLTIYNTLTQEKETFKPLEEGKVRMYVCGPTVYNYIHIGNARPAIVFDTVRRYFEYKGYQVDYVLNFTDVDDKIIKAANELGEQVPDVANRFIDAYLEDIGSLGVKEATYNPRVTETMDDIIDFIANLIDKGYAYEVDGDVYFKPRSFDGYGKLSHQSIDELRSGARIQVGEKKRDPLDFALWKKAKGSEIAWGSPWGQGRPGWHIECSAMAKKYLGETIDIHAGGQDLTFPHHENEIAQSESMNEKPFAHYWMHNGYINIDNEKMSKSLGNFVLTRDIISQHDPQVVRFFMLSVHYRNPINFTEELLQGSKNSLDRVKNAYLNLEHRKEASMNLNRTSETWQETINDLNRQFEAAMDDDLNTANAISVLFELTKEANRYLEEKQTSTHVIESFQESIDSILLVLGIQIKQAEELLDEEVDSLIKERTEARKNRDFNRADEIRDTLKAKNIILEDTPQGTRWKRGDNES